MFTRQEYLAAAGETTELTTADHRRYYAQFVDERVKQLVLQNIGREALLASTDFYFNDKSPIKTAQALALARWDFIVLSSQLPTAVATKMTELGDYLTLAGGVCILKEAARQIVEASK